DLDYKWIIGTSGTVTNIGMIINSEENNNNDELFNYNNFSYSKESLNKVVKKITKCEKVSEIKEIKGLDQDRIAIITSGTIILEQIFSELKLESITLSNFSLREGILFDSINKEHNTLLKEDLSDIRYRSIINLAENCRYDRLHSEQVLKL
ncbi:MAG: hypothetical protein NTU73_13410, partial [Ignavibacteriae bacterium]|nr:hypothetical protein [Ignavibacteriota bacterium]